jgi:hypothetical protein
MPFAGEGVDCGMLDALELSRGVVSAITNGEDLDGGIEVFGKRVWERIGGIARETGEPGDDFADDALGGL